MKNIDYDIFEEHIKNKEKNKIIAKEGKLRQAFQEAIMFYSDYFYGLGLAADNICKDCFATIISKN